ncbi:MAG: type II secretion system protein [Tepidisphaeraceae bacterium]
MQARVFRHRGFTLVEILIVVIILGILAAIVIPQFTNASQDARKSSLTSQLQTIRSQVALYKMQHLDEFPPGFGTTTAAVTSATAWAEMTEKTNEDHTTTGEPRFGPYIQSAPVNPLNGKSDVYVINDVGVDFGNGAGDATTGTGNQTAPAAAGWIVNIATGKVWATAKDATKIYNEASPSDSGNTD